MSSTAGMQHLADLGDRLAGLRQSPVWLDIVEIGLNEAWRYTEAMMNGDATAHVSYKAIISLFNALGDAETVGNEMRLRIYKRLMEVHHA